MRAFSPPRSDARVTALPRECGEPRDGHKIARQEVRMATKQELEEQKLALEIAALKRPNARNPTFWISVVTATVAVIGVFAQSYISKFEVARSDLAVAQARADAASAIEQRDRAGKELAGIQNDETSARQRVADLDTERANLEARVAQLVKAVDNTPASPPEVKVAAKAAANAYYSVGVYSFGAPPQIMPAFVAKLHDAGYTVIKAQVLAQRPPWLSAHTAVLYYDDASRAKAQWIATQLQAAGAADVAIDKGSGTGIPAGREATSFRVHIVG
ncbi:MAG TPA: hypothetical protein VIP05_00420 [Burkholderiaceae bacterium]